MCVCAPPFQKPLRFQYIKDYNKGFPQVSQRGWPAVGFKGDDITSGDDDGWMESISTFPWWLKLFDFWAKATQRSKLGRGSGVTLVHTASGTVTLIIISFAADIVLIALLHYVASCENSDCHQNERRWFLFSVTQTLFIRVHKIIQQWWRYTSLYYTCCKFKPQVSLFCCTLTILLPALYLPSVDLKR